MRKVYLLLVLFCSIATIQAQDFSNKGKEFYLCFPSHVPSGGNLAEMSLFITSDKNSSGTVTYNGVTSNFAVTANSVIEVPITRSAAYITDAESNSPVAKGILVKTNPGQPAVVVYSHIYAGFRTAATLVLPTNVLGRKYQAISYFQAGTGGSKSQFQIITIESNTVVKIQLRKNGTTSGLPFNVTIPNAGSVYQIQDDLDLSGSEIESISVGAEPCKKIAVFSGSSALSLSRSGCNGSSFDPLNQQCYPVSTWGFKFGVIPIVNNQNGYQARVMASEDNTSVDYGGTTVVMNKGEVYPAITQNVTAQTGAIFISADKPICVSQYLMSQNCAANPPVGDPDMIILNPIEQNIDDITIFTSTKQTILQQHMNVLIRTADAASFSINGTLVGAGFFTPMPTDPTFSYYRHTFTPVSQSSFRLKANNGFNATCYGLGSAESYGYSAGTNVKDFSQLPSIDNPLSVTGTPIACKNSPFFLFQSLPYKPISIEWDFSTSGLPNPPFSNFISNTPASIFVDSTLINGKWIFKYKNPNQYTATTVGIFPVTIKVNNPSADGCTGLQEIDYDLEIVEKPNVNFIWTHTGCVSDTVYFEENTVITDNYPVYKWRWLYHDNTTDTVKKPKKLYSTSGSFPVKLQAITEAGCLSDTLTKVINITNPPVCTLQVTGGAACAGNLMTFTPSCSIVGNPANNGSDTTIVKWVWIWGDGSPNDTLLSAIPATHTYLLPGTYTIKVVAISSSGCTGSSLGLTLTVNGAPSVNFDLPANVCLPVGLATFTNTSPAGAAGSYTWNFGDASPTTNTFNGVHNYTAAGPFTVTLTGLVNGCGAGIQKVFNNIRPRPTAAFTNNPEVCVNKNIIFTSTSTGNGGTIVENYWDNGSGSFVLGTANLTATYTTSGNKIIRHYVKTDQGCISDTASKTIYVNALPLANFTFSNLGRCARIPITFNNTSTAADGAINFVSWNFGDGSPVVNISTPPFNNPVQHVYALDGTYNVKLVVKTDKGCEADTITLPIVITATPVASFILPSGICLPSGFAQFTNNTTISDGTIATVTYTWDFGDATPPDFTFSPSHIYSGTGPYPVKLIAKSAIGCVDDSVQTLSTIFAQPQASMAGNAEVCLNANITLTSTSTPINGTITEHYWDNGSGSFVLGAATLTTSYATSGNKTIRHYIKTSNGCISDTATKTIFVNQLPSASYTYSAIQCARDTIQFTSTAIANNGVVVEWTWDFGDGTPVQVLTNSNPVPHVFALSGTYSVKLTVKTDKGCVSTASTQSVVVNAKPVANFNLPANVCLPVGAALFTNTTTISDGTLPQVSYVWDFGDLSPTTTSLDGAHNYSAAGPFNVKLKATSNKSCVHDTVKIFNNIRPRPTASFTSTAEVCVNASITYTSTSVGNGGTINENYWDNGSGSFVLGTTTLTATYTTSGNKTIRHYVKTDQGCISDTASKTIYVNALPTPNFSFNNPQCAGKDITFTNSSIANDGLITSWAWNFGDGSAVVNGVGPHIHNYAATGTYNVSLSVSTDKGCSNATPVVKVVTISPNPVIKMYLPEICLNDPTAQFLDSSTIADGTEAGFSYLWNFGDPNATIPNPNTSTLKDPTHKYIQAANYNMWLEITSNKGCKTRKDTVFTVNGAIPVASFAVQNAANLCSNQDVTIQNTSTVNFGNVTYLEIYWDWGNNPLLKTIDNNPTPGKLYSYGYTPFGSPATKTFTIRMVAYSGSITGPCLNVATQTVTILASPNIVFIAVPDICLENPVATINQAQETTGVVGVGVFTGPGIVGNQFNPSVAGVGTHTIRYTFTAANSCSMYKEQTITVNPTPNVNAGPDKTVLEGGSVVLEGSSTTTNVAYLWSPATFLNSNTVPQPSTSPNDDLSYTLKVTSDKSCVATDVVFVKVLKGPRVPNAFSPNGDGINDRWDIEFLDTYPGCIVEVFNIYGEKVFRSIGYGTSWDGSFKGKQLPLGTYYYIIEPKNGRKPLTGYVGIVR
jgi:gliding motility-associated-like protein